MGSLPLHWAIGCCFLSAKAQIFDFVDFPLPHAWSLSSHYMFFAQDVEGKDHRATVIFQDLRIRLDKSDDQQSEAAAAAGSGQRRDLKNRLQSYHSAQVALLHYNRFWDMVDPEHFCSESGLVLKSSAESALSQSVTYAAGDEDPAVQANNLTEDGIYILVFANCGNISKGAVLTGSVALRHAWGFLPPTEYHKPSFFLGMVVVNACIAFAWLLLALRWWKTLYYFQKGITFVAMLALLEVLLWWIFYDRWNVTGRTTILLHLFVETISVGKFVLSLRLLLMPNYSLDPLTTEEEKHVSLSTFLALLVHTVFTINMHVCLFYRGSLALKGGYIAMNSAPAILSGMGLLLLALRSTTEALNEKVTKRNDSHVRLLTQMQALLGACLPVTALVICVQIVDPTSLGDVSLWHVHFLVSDALVQVPSMLVLVATMYIWLPGQITKGYEYAPAAVQEEECNVIGAPEGMSDQDSKNEEYEEEGGSDREKFHLEVDG